MKEAGCSSDAGPVYLGIDIAGAKNTWVAALSWKGDGLRVVHGPCLATLKEVVGYCEENDAVAAAIDAQLTIALSEENGFRASDTQLKDLLQEIEPDYGNWVMSFNALMAVPIRGRLLADHLSPTVGTLIETHPRASLLFGLDHAEDDISTAIRHYKTKSSDTRAQAEAREPHVRQLWRHWSERFGITHREPEYHDGALDSLVCATVAYLFHHAPGELYKLRHDVAGKAGRGPFYVVSPKEGSDARGV